MMLSNDTSGNLLYYASFTGYSLIIINHILLYCILICSFYLCARCNMIYKKLTSVETINNNITVFNSQSGQMHRDLKVIRTKSYDLFDTTLVLKKHSDELQNEVNILKHKQYCYDKDMSLKN